MKSRLIALGVLLLTLGSWQQTMAITSPERNGPSHSGLMEAIDLLGIRNALSQCLMLGNIARFVSVKKDDDISLNDIVTRLDKALEKDGITDIEVRFIVFNVAKEAYRSEKPSDEIGLATFKHCIKGQIDAELD
ncbi:MAG: hypothetical protein ABFS45_03635 [Pseudomonadota bacterium]